MIFATSTERAIGLVILAVVVVGGLAYLLFNLMSGRKEMGSEIELAPNRKPYYDDEVLETTKLERSQLAGLVTLGVIGVTLPLYWLAEPGRQDGWVDTWDRTFTNRGTEIYEGFCSSCHGPDAGGGVAAYTITDEDGAFVANVSWVAPGLTTVLSRFDEDEVRHILNWGRGVMPAWGADGGGALTEQQIDELIFYLRTVQRTDEEDIQEVVMGGVLEQARTHVLEDQPELAEALEDAQADLADARAALDDADEADRDDAQDAVDEAQEAVDEATAAIAAAAQRLYDRVTAAGANDRDQRLYGELLFGNPAGNAEFNCARCHTNGWSYGARSEAATAALIAEWPRLESTGILTGFRSGAGAFGPSLWSIASSYPTVSGHVDFVTVGGGFGPQDSNQMPGFGGREDPVLTDAAGNPVRYPAVLTPEQIAAIVAYERSLGE
jgi:mono/diheme cytochrome c family protein